MTKSVLRQAMVCASALVVLAAPDPAFAQGRPNTTRPIGGYLNAHFGVASPTEPTFTSVGSETFGNNRNEAKADYPTKAGLGFEFGGGIVIKRRWVVGAAFSRAGSSEVGLATVTLHHPATHPDLADSIDTAPLDRREAAFHIQGGMLLPPMGRFELMVFAGPTRFAVSQHTVDDLSAQETFSSSTVWMVTVSDPQSVTNSATAWGYNLGVDASVSVGRGVSLGSLIRYSRATVSIEDNLNSLVADKALMKDMTVGGVQVLGGVRWRF
jgi:hypothetical protein